MSKQKVKSKNKRVTRVINKETYAYYDKLFEQQQKKDSVRQLPEPERQR